MKIYLISWSVICKYKKHGGLGLRHLEGFNQACYENDFGDFPKKGRVFGGKSLFETLETWGVGPLKR